MRTAKINREKGGISTTSPQTVNCGSDIPGQIVSAFIIEKDGEIKEKFSYEIPFNGKTQQSLVAYSQANYGAEAVFRLMTDEEKADFIAPNQEPTGWPVE